MPIQPTYPGVYIEEVPSGVRTIIGVATSITAFIGRAKKGPVEEPVTINNFGDYERQFGGLWVESTMSYAVQDFYLNGGAQAIIIRIENGAETVEIALPVASPPDFLVTLQAGSPGSWANVLRASVDYQTQDPTALPGSPPPGFLQAQTTFNLIVYEWNEELKRDDKVEEYLGVSMDPNAVRYLPRVLEQRSGRIKVKKNDLGNWPSGIPLPTPVDSKLQPVPVRPVSEARDGVNLEAHNYAGSPNLQTGIYALKKTDLFNILCIPPPTRGADTDSSVYFQALELCVKSRAMLLVDPPAEWGANIDQAVLKPIQKLASLRISGPFARNAALYYPLVIKKDPLRENQLDTFVPCGIIAGIMAFTDTSRGVWKSPAGLDAAMNGVEGLQVNLSDPENGQLNQLGINCLRSFGFSGLVVWGARTMRGANQLADEYKYIAVRRTALFIEETLYRSTKWVVFEPNDKPLWSQIRLNIGAFMHNLFRQGAFQGSTPREAYLVKCDEETTTQNDVDQGIVNIIVGFAPLKPAEFVIIKIQQLAGQIET